MKDKIIFILGPTSSGKSAIAVRLAEAINGQVISCDSMQIYKDMDIITQAPSMELTSRVRHHLVREISPEKEFSAADFSEKALVAITEIIEDKNIPVIAGGTGLYVKALIDGLFESPPKDNELRDRYNSMVREKGIVFLYNKLEKIDPDVARNIHPNDLRRIVRALEVYELTGIKMSDKKKDTEGIYEKYDCRIFGLELPREELYARINAAVDCMFEAGLVNEVEKLERRELSLTAEKALGIKEVKAFLSGKLVFENMVDELKKNTRNYAKRQMTWFRADKRIVWINAGRQQEKIVNDIMKNIYSI